MTKPRPPRPLTAVDRMLAWSDDNDRAAADAGFGDPPKARRRTHRRFGQLDVVVVERTDASTVVYLTNDEGVIVEAKASELIEAVAAVQELLANPPPIRRRK